MAGRFQRVFLALGFPTAIIAICSVYWLRRRRKAILPEPNSSIPVTEEALAVKNTHSESSSKPTSATTKLDPAQVVAGHTQESPIGVLLHQESSDSICNTANNTDALINMQLREEKSSKPTAKRQDTQTDNSIVVEVDLREGLTKMNLMKEAIDDSDKPKLVKLNAKNEEIDQNDDIKGEAQRSEHSDSNSGADSGNVSPILNTATSNNSTGANPDDNSVPAAQVRDGANSVHSSEPQVVIASEPASPSVGKTETPNAKSSANKNDASSVLSKKAEKIGSTTANCDTSSAHSTDRVEQHSPEDNSYACSDILSEGSSDSGKGCSEGFVDSPTSNAALYNSRITYQFVLPSLLCGKLIGKGGHFVHQIKQETNANIIVSSHPFSQEAKICSVEGNRQEVRLALQMIRQRFPLRVHPEVTLQQINAISPVDSQNCTVTLSRSCQLPLVHGVSSDVILSSLVSAGQFFLQQPTHPTYPGLQTLDQMMTASYSHVDAPTVPNPTAGIVVAVPILNGWFRALVVEVYDNNECEVKFVDYGGYSRLPNASLKQIRYDFMFLPFQAAECFLADVKPTNDGEWSTQANSFFEELAQGQILQAIVTGYTQDGSCHVRLYKIQGATSININEELVKHGHASWAQPETSVVAAQN